jgi:hypothetical protein
MSNPAKNRFVHLAGSIFAAVILFLSTGPDAHAQAAYDVYGVKIYYGTDTTICVGQTTTITVAYHLNAGKKAEAPPILSFQVTDGQVTSENPTTGGAGSGFVYFSFYVTKAEDAALYAQVNQTDGYAMTTIPVQNCQYTYNLVAKVHTTSSDQGTVFKWTQILIFDGTFTPSAPGVAPLAPLVPNATIQTNLVIQDEEMPPDDECNVPATTWTGLQGSGTAKVTGQLVNGPPQAGVTIDFATVDIVKWAPTYNIPCKDGPLNKTLVLNFQQNDWAHEQFPISGGSREIQIDFLEQGVKNLNASPGTTASYDAILTVKRVK